MRAMVVALVLLGFISGCARHQASSPQASAPSASPTERPDLVHKSAVECEKAGRQWNATSGVCL